MTHLLPTDSLALHVHTSFDVQVSPPCYSSSLHHPRTCLSPKYLMLFLLLFLFPQDSRRTPSPTAHIPFLQTPNKNPHLPPLPSPELKSPVMPNHHHDQQVSLLSLPHPNTFSFRRRPCPSDWSGELLFFFF
jgi:hypothetical protein